MEARLALRRSKLWLVLGITAATLAVGAETAAILCTLEARDQYHGKPAGEAWRNGALSGHLLAGTFAAAAAAVSFFLHLRVAPPLVSPSGFDYN